ncbi:zeta toxin family protein [Amycolatopsis sp. NPDC059021]|uniref:zeta toxin family protein n=1 Tax=Amycolatopsis sp. NPDC059021 TaxID=3346704 RepID=UPI0036714ECA
MSAFSRYPLRYRIPVFSRWWRMALGALVAVLVAAVPQAASAAVSSREPLTDAQWAAHLRLVDQRIDQEIHQGRETDVLFTIGHDREHWLPSRARLQRQVAEKLYARGSAVPSAGKAVLTGGLPGAGKTTVLNDNPFVRPQDYLVLSSDDAKELMCAGDMIPAVDGLAPMEASDLIQREAARITEMVADRARRERRNVIWDTTMASVPAIDKRVAPLRKAGYTEISALFLDLPIEVSVQRIDQRHRSGYERYRNGERCEGRHVPASLVRRQADPVWSSRNRASFEATKHEYDHWYLYDSTRLPPTLAARG